MEKHIHDEALFKILEEGKSVIGFLSTIFDFLARRTDFYYVPEGPYENLGFPPGVAEEIVVKVLRNCDPKLRNNTNTNFEPDNDLLPTTAVAQEVEIEAEETDVNDNIYSDEACTQDSDHNYSQQPNDNRKPGRQSASLETCELSSDSSHTETNSPDIKAARSSSIVSTTEDTNNEQIEYQKASESYNGAVRGKYSWSQSIRDLDVTVELPREVKSSKQLRVNITADAICVQCLLDKQFLIDDKLSYKTKTEETMWTISDGRLAIHLEKQQERWWHALLKTEPKIDLSKIDCSRPIEELPEDHIAKVRELQWNHSQKLQGKQTSDEIKKIDVLRKAWDMEGSPFRGKPFDPSVIRN